MVSSLLHVFLLVAAAPAPWVPAEEGMAVSAPRILSTAGRGVAVTATSSGFAAFWLEAGDGAHVWCIVGQRLADNGEPIGAAARLGCDKGLIGPAAAAGGNTVAVAWGTAGGVVGVTLAEDLSKRGDFFQAIGRFPSSVDVAHDGKSFVVVWAGHQDIGGLRVSHEGTSLGSGAISIAQARGTTSHGRVACAAAGCAVYHQQFHGNSRAEIDGVALRDGARSGGYPGQEGAFEVAVAGKDERLQVFTSTYARIIGTDVLATDSKAARIFDYESSTHQMHAPRAATGEGGTLVSWSMSPRKAGQQATAIAFVHPSPAAARPYPVMLDGGEPAVATRDGRRFLLLTAFRHPSEVKLRVIDVDPTVFAKAPSARGPVAMGVVRGADGKPAPGAQVFYFMRLAGGLISNGGTTAGPEGAFAIKHPRQDELRDEATVTQLVLWGGRENEVSPPYINLSGPLTVQLRAVDPNRLGRVRLTALDLHRDRRWQGDLSVLLAPGVKNNYGLARLKAGRVLELDNVVPGEHALLLLDNIGFHVGQKVEIAPGLETIIEMPFEVDVAPGMVGIALADHGSEAQARLVVPGSPAERAGVKMGDVLTEIDGQPAGDAVRSKKLLAGAPGAQVRIRVQRGRGSEELILRRSPGGPPRPARSRTAPIPPPSPELQAARAAVAPRPGEKLLEAVPIIERAPRDAGEPFRVDIPEGVEIFSPLRVYLNFGKEIFEPGIPVVLTLTGPGDLLLTKEYNFYNMVTASPGCDPTVGGGPDPCARRRFPMSVGGPAMEFEVGELDTMGICELTAHSPGTGTVRQKLRVTGLELGRGYDRHQHQRIGSYRMVARAALETDLFATSGGALIHRAVFRDGGHRVEVDMIEPRLGHTISPRSFFEREDWREVPSVEVKLRRQQIKLRQRDGSFEAAWPASGMVIRISGDRYGPAEEQLIEQYLGFYASHW